MLFAIICTDKPGALETRMATRAQHLAYLQAYQERIREAGPLLGPDGRPSGSMLLVDVEDRAAAEGFAASDPYAKADVFESVVIRAFRPVFRDGALVE
ncbi:YCII-related [Gluconacetobacter diazotrophicus PA1 5]|nr:YciI family protein [Gluconacetobacter diazotrophicus]ACI52667.1 YCII-related [Gluconacetobacter diazotrophicus PA1 5]MBB2156420.1 YciI family protein [Gluconacetobacter diazotrophicus]TWB06074.1 hypothetical protein FBZ86_11364 [Gluconacetobacter diazotrophicus]